MELYCTLYASPNIHLPQVYFVENVQVKLMFISKTEIITI